MVQTLLFAAAALLAPAATLARVHLNPNEDMMIDLGLPIYDKIDSLAAAANAVEAEIEEMIAKEEEKVEELFKLAHPANSQDAVFVPPGICDDVHSIAGYYRVNDEKRYWYWAFASRNDPSTDPVMLWLTGGPGCSSQVALFHEHGPCVINKDHKTTSINPYSWNMNATVIYIDQPAGVGFSTGPSDETGEWDIAPQMWSFLQHMFEANPNIRGNEFFIFGESYAGHFVPAVSWYIMKMNEAGMGKHWINLAGIGVGNGMTNPLLQEPQYPEYAVNNRYRKLVDAAGEKAMRDALPMCTKLVEKCANGADKPACEEAAMVCNGALVGPVQGSGINVYDVREECKNPPLCYDFTDVDEFLNLPHIRKILGVDGLKWEPCNHEVNTHFQADWMVSYAPNVTALINSGVRVLVYAGECDFICNWMGNKAWALDLEWRGKKGFNRIGDKPWLVNGEKKGEVRSYGPLTFLNVFEAGHMVPLDQPEAAQVLFNTFIFNLPFHE